MMIRISLLALLLSAPVAASEIHKCVDEDGSVTYQQTPCPAPVESEPLEPTPAADEQPSAEQMPVEQPTNDQPAIADLPMAEPATTGQRKPEDEEACKIPLREAIDEIEAEMLRGYSAEQGEEFKRELRELTEQMRACE